MTAVARARSSNQVAGTSDIGAMHALGMFDLSVALLSADLRLLDRIAVADRIFDPVFRVVGDQIVFCSPLMRARFDAVLCRAEANGRLGQDGWISDVFALRIQKSMPLLVRILAAPRTHAPTALVVVLDLSAERQVPEHLLRSAFGLTAAEAALASNLINGRTLREICDVSKVRISTLRSQLAGVLAKTGTSRQAHLVSLLSKVAVPASRRAALHERG